jgi:hypothetical protein
MKRRFLLLAAMLILCNAAFGKDKVLKPDREISITSVEHRETGKPYRVEGQTTGSKITLYYKLACGTGAADLEVGHVYKAAEITTEGNKAFVIWYVTPDPDTNAFGVMCDVESVKDH